MKILHTSDLHIGKVLRTKKRYDEFEQLLTWLAQTLDEQCIDVLVVAGDIFDTSMPSNKAQKLYHKFLAQVVKSHCQHVIIVAGNHDSPTLLDAPKEILGMLNVRVVGSACSDPSDEVFVLEDSDGAPQLIVCAVPYLRDRDIRTSQAGETFTDKEKKISQGIKNHYARVGEAAVARRQELNLELPILATGHLYVSGSTTVEDDGLRKLYIGTLGEVASDVFPDSFDYVALGHIHVKQKVGKSETIRYCGSPIPMSFGEANQQKMVNIVSFDNGNTVVEPLEVPVFQTLVQIKGDLETITKKLKNFAKAGIPVWADVTYDADAVVGSLERNLADIVDGTCVEIIPPIKNLSLASIVSISYDTEESLSSITPSEIFEKRLDAGCVPEEQREELKVMFDQIVTELEQHDENAE